MKHTFKKILSAILSLIMVVSTTSLMATSVFAAETDFSSLVNGETIEFGSYPNSEVTDAKTLASLNSLPLNWTYYDYYAGTDTANPSSCSVGSMKKMNLMKYADVEYNGERYRAVYMEKYRPNNTLLVPSTDNSLIDNYGYNLKTIYWFKYEPLVWIVLDAENGIVMSQNSIDAQPFNNNQYANGNNIYSDKYNYFADDYSHSSIREWLNNDFFSTAFNSENIKLMETSDITINTNTVSDYVYILSGAEASNPSYGFNTDLSVKDEARRAASTPYAISQGLIVQQYGTNWITRSAGNTAFGHSAITGINHGGNSNKNFSTSSCTIGVRPVINLNTEKAEPKPVENVPYTVEIYTMNTDGQYECKTETRYGTEGDTVEYAYTETEGFTFDKENSIVKGIVSVEKPLVLKVYILRNSYQLKTVSGTSFAAVSYYYGETIPDPDTPMKEHYNFTGWSPAVPAAMPAKDMVCTAQFTPKTYTVTFIVDNRVIATEGYTIENKNINIPDIPVKDGYNARWEDFNLDCTNIAVDAIYTKNSYNLTWEAGTLNGSIALPYGAPINLEEPYIEGYTFTGWNETVPATMPAHNLHLTAKMVPNIYTVTWVIDGIPFTSEVSYGEKISLPDTPNKDNYSFIGWNTEIPDTMPATNLTFNAVFKPNVYTVTFIADNEIVDVKNYTVEDKNITAPSVPDKTGYSAEWEPYTLNGENITVEAIYTKNNYTVTWVVDNNETVVNVLYGDAIEIPVEPKKLGAEFIGWDGDIPDTMPAANLVFTAEWALIEYSVEWTFDGTVVTHWYLYGEKITVPNAPDKNGYTFVGWSPEVPNTMPDTNLCFTPIYTPNTYTVTFNANGGLFKNGNKTDTKTFLYNENIIPVEPPVKLGYEFAGWDNLPEIMSSSDITVTAKWVPSSATVYTIETYTKDTVGNYTKTTEKKLGTTGEAVNLTPNVNDGFELNTTKSVLNGIVSAEKPLVLKVYFERKSYNFTVNVDGKKTTTSYLYGSIISEPITPVKTGYTFKQWSESIPSAMPAHSIEVSAEWAINSHTITWFMDGKKVTEKYNYNDTVKTPSAPEKKGYKFVGWDTSVPSRMPDKDLVFTAKYERVPDATIAIKNNTGSKTINHGETLRLTAIAKNIPAEAAINWYIGNKFAGTGETFDYSYTNGTNTVTAVLEYNENNPVTDINNEIVLDTEEIIVKANIFTKIVSFFKKLFGVKGVISQ